MARSQRSREAIVSALRDLHVDGQLRPTADTIAHRAGVSVRTLWQHFEDLDSLWVQAGEVDYETTRVQLTRIDPAAPLEERLDQVVAQRVRLYERSGPVWRAAGLQEPFSESLRGNRRRVLTLLRRQVTTVFRSEIGQFRGVAKTRFVDGVDVVLGWSTWESLRVEQGLDASSRRAVVRMLALALLRSTPPEVARPVTASGTGRLVR
jgi:AcrR family transcriptional regulator